MDSQLIDLIITASVTLFLAFFATLWLWQSNKYRPGTFSLPIKKYRAIVRQLKYGKVPTLCSEHAKNLIVNKGRMALINNHNCELCTGKSKLI